MASRIADNQWNLSLHGLKNSSGSTGWGYVNNSSIGRGFFHGLSYCVKNGQVQMKATTLASPDTPDHVGTVFNCLFGMECTLFSGKTLANYFGFFCQGHGFVGFSITCPCSGGCPCGNTLHHSHVGGHGVKMSNSKSLRINVPNQSPEIGFELSREAHRTSRGRWRQQRWPSPARSQ